jgi:hypothetical protein
MEASVSLETGDCLTREEFHRRYLARPDIKKAELIDGVVYVPSPVRIRRHARPHAFVVGWLSQYVALVPHVILADNGTIYLDERVEVQPDATGLIESAQFPSLRLHVDSMLAGDLSAVLAYLRPTL